MTNTYQQYFSNEHEMARQAARRFVQKEIAPFVDAWEEAGSFPRELYQKAAAAGILGVGYPEEWGGVPGDLFMQIVIWEELARAGSGGVAAGLGSLNIALPPILLLGTDEQKERFIRPVLTGEQVAALAITEPGGGSDVANLQTTAVRHDDHYLINGSKTFITSGCRADVLTTAVRTGGPGAQGISLLVIPGDTPGLSRSQPLKKMGWWASDTAQLFFDDCRVPVANLIGPENMGFYAIMANFTTVHF
ncbi:MAG: hypothetical protein HND44_23880 [Chloroflexi bacterium]|nr:acyl-CoA dehydrogenase family protein [Ardenticatenaceae bacterium]MBL1131471.1 hypothetical protein [Chloroflexota bacterium]NOG37582.1 hypothetical protein [Chloroflexota bacterium]